MKEVLTRRQTLATSAAGATLAVLPACQTKSPPPPPRPAPPGGDDVQDDVIVSVRPLPPGAPWETLDPFLFCVHHDDAYPAGNERMGPKASLAGRNLGQDFEGREGWRMYHGEVVPGFPQHPHRGFETVTVARRGFIDHADSLGATARYGAGDAQWLTAGAGIVHAEMFPLRDLRRPNPLELFQIWLNLPAADKFVTPHFSMFWREAIPAHTARDDAGRRTTVTVVAGQVADARAAAPPPHSWASRPQNQVAIWTIAMEPGARWTLPPAAAGINRALYFFRGSSLAAATVSVPVRTRVQVRGDAAVELTNGPAPGEILLLQARPIGEPVVQHGPFVMNSRAEIEQAFADYRRTGFGGWPWPSADPVHRREEGRFAKHADGRHERAG
jgi:redox-sensitive bicupin YhaK (pirin superfamily)